MRTLIVLVCFSAVAYALEESVDEPSNFQYARSVNSEINGNSFEDSSTVSGTEVFSKPNELRGRYRATPNEYNEKSTPREVVSQICKEKNERYPVPGSCDRYVECLNGTATEKLCPDGLRYNPNVRFNVYPCQYPIDVPCLERSALQPPQPTENCPHQFGYYKIGDARNCSGFRNCVHGVAHDFVCPEGLAFSSSNYRCEWPDEVEDCDAEAFLGFRCPEVPESKELGPPAGYRTYRSPQDCQIYFICINGRPRRLSCGGFAAFDELTGSCVAADEVPACPEELRKSAARTREAEIERQAVQNAYEKFKYERKLSNYSPTTLQPLFSDIEIGTKYPEQE